MSRSPIPAGYHDAESAAILLGVTKRYLLKHLREMGWLVVGGDSHNLPRKELKRAGLMTTQDRAHCLKGKKEIVKSYQVMLLTQAGFQELKKYMAPQQDDVTTTAQATSTLTTMNTSGHVSLSPEEKPYDKQTSDIERQKILKQMSDWGISIAVGQH